MSIEGVVAIRSGAAADNLSLTAFGWDSVIELISAGILIWRLTVELRQGQVFSEHAERLASRIGGGLLFALALFIALEAVESIWTRQGGRFSGPGAAVTVLAFPIMFVLARRKLDVARRLGSRAMRADAIESLTCGWLSLAVVLGLIARWLLDAWWIDPSTSLVILWFVVKEGHEAWTGDPCVDRC